MIKKNIKRKRRLNKKLKVNGFEEISIFFKFSYESNDEEKYDDFIFNQIEPFIDRVVGLRRRNPNYKTVYWNGGFGSLIDGKAEYQGGFSFPRTIRKLEKELLIENIIKNSNKFRLDEMNFEIFEMDDKDYNDCCEKHYKNDENFENCENSIKKIIKSNQ